MEGKLFVRFRSFKVSVARKVQPLEGTGDVSLSVILKKERRLNFLCSRYDEQSDSQDTLHSRRQNESYLS